MTEESSKQPGSVTIIEEPTQTDPLITEKESSKTDNDLITDLNSDHLNFDTILSTIGFGKYQLKTYLIMGLLAMSEGAQVMAFTLMVPVLANQWGISDFINSLQASLIFVSFLIGSVLSGQFSDRYGRRRPCIYSSFLMCIFSILSAFSPEIITLIALRICLGLLVGFFGPLGATMITELTPKQSRGKYMALLTASMVIGELYGSLTAYFFLENLSSGDWRILIIFCTIPGAISFILAVLFLRESPRYELVAGHYGESFIIIEKMAEENNSKEYLELSGEDRRKLIKWAEDMNNESMKSDEAASLKSLFRNERKYITPLIWFNWFTSSFVYYGIIVFMPYILEKISSSGDKSEDDLNDIIKILISTAIEIVSVALAATVIEHKSFGRKNSMIIFYALGCFTCIVVYFMKDVDFVVFATIARFFLSITIIFCYQFTSEIYPTKIRTTGLGMANGIGRLGGIVMPWVCVALLQINLYAPFLAFATLSLFSSSLSYLFPYDTTGKDLDTVQGQKKS